MMRAVSTVVACLMMWPGPCHADPGEVSAPSLEWAVPPAPKSSGFISDWWWVAPDHAHLLQHLVGQGDPLALSDAYGLSEYAGKRPQWLAEMVQMNDPGVASIRYREVEHQLAVGKATQDQVWDALRKVPKGAMRHNLGAGEAVLPENRHADAPGCGFYIMRQAFSPLQRRVCLDGAANGSGWAAYRLGLVSQLRADDFDDGFTPKIRRASLVLEEDIRGEVSPRYWPDVRRGLVPLRPSLKDAVGWYEKAVADGYAPAQGRLALLTALGHGVKRDDAEAVRLAREAAAHHDPEGLAVLGLLTLQGRGLPADDKAGMDLVREAAERGNRMAQYTMATLCFRGRGIPRDWVEGLAWLRLLHLDLLSGRRGDPAPEEWGDLMLEPWPRTTQIGNYFRQSPEGDLDAIARAATMRKRFAAEGKWPY